MQINISGPHIDVTQAIRNVINGKFERLQRHFEKISHIDIVCDVEKLNQIAQATLFVDGAKIMMHAKAEASNLYCAIDDLVKKLEKQLAKHKEKHLR